MEVKEVDPPRLIGNAVGTIRVDKFGWNWWKPNEITYSVQIGLTSGYHTNDIDKAKIMSMLALICKKLKIDMNKRKWIENF